jgi:hypothetical protein
VFPIRISKGQLVQYESPQWQPLLDLAPDQIDDFMWMHEIELESGLRVHAYKHRETRRYLHLDIDGRAFVYLEPDRYDEREPDRYGEVDPEQLLATVLARRTGSPCHE